LIDGIKVSCGMCHSHVEGPEHFKVNTQVCYTCHFLKGANHGGRLVAKTLASRGVSKLFTLSGGHLFSIYDGCREEGIDIVDTRRQAPGPRGLRRRRASRDRGAAAGGDQRNERDRGRVRSSPCRARRPRARDALGLGIARVDCVDVADQKSAATVKETGDPGRHQRRSTPRGRPQPTFLDYPSTSSSWSEAEIEPRSAPPGGRGRRGGGAILVPPAPRDHGGTRSLGAAR
jgi:hypothetical protein